MTIIKEIEIKGIKLQLKEIGNRYTVLRYLGGWLHGMVSYDNKAEAEAEYDRQVEYYK